VRKISLGAKGNNGGPRGFKPAYKGKRASKGGKEVFFRETRGPWGCGPFPGEFAVCHQRRALGKITSCEGKNVVVGPKRRGEGALCSRTLLGGDL